MANAGPDQTTATGQAVTLDGTGSSDADGKALSYRWRVSTAVGSAAALSAATAPRPTFPPDRSGTYVFGLVVNDGAADSPGDGDGLDDQFRARGGCRPGPHRAARQR